MPEGTPEEIPLRTPEVILQRTPRGVPEECFVGTTGGIPKGATKEISDELLENIPEGSVGEVLD